VFRGRYGVAQLAHEAAEFVHDASDRLGDDVTDPR
jgi:hypothetical protein